MADVQTFEVNAKHEPVNIVSKILYADTHQRMKNFIKNLFCLKSKYMNVEVGWMLK
jgi:hypothetical protein